MLRIDKTRCTAAEGFTLIEVVVALVIASLGLALLMKAVASGMAGVTIANRQIQAVSLAQSHLATVAHTVPLKIGDYSGDDGGGFHWHVRIANPSSHAGAGNHPVTALYSVKVFESWHSGDSQRTVSLYSERAGPP